MNTPLPCNACHDVKTRPNMTKNPKPLVAQPTTVYLITGCILPKSSENSKHKICRVLGHLWDLTNLTDRGVSPSWVHPGFPTRFAISPGPPDSRKDTSAGLPWRGRGVGGHKAAELNNRPGECRLYQYFPTRTGGFQRGLHNVYHVKRVLSNHQALCALHQT